jgi:hypothetical protein
MSLQNPIVLMSRGQVLLYIAVRQAVCKRFSLSKVEGDYIPSVFRSQWEYECILADEFLSDITYERLYLLAVLLKIPLPESEDDRES